MRLIVAIAGLMLAAGPAAAQSMNAENFYKRAMALQKKGALALFSRSEIKALMKEAQAAGKASGAEAKAAKAAGRPARFCAPDGPQKMGSDEYMRRLAAIPRADRQRITMTEATTRIMAAKFPCG